MTEQELQEIEARAAAATPGPWVVLPRGAWAVEHPETDGSYLGISVTPAVYDKDGDPIENGGAEGPANCSFIAHAREDVPALVEQIRQLEKWCSRLAEAAHDAFFAIKSQPPDSERCKCPGSPYGGAGHISTFCRLCGTWGKCSESCVSWKLGQAISNEPEDSEDPFVGLEDA